MVVPLCGTKFSLTKHRETPTVSQRAGVSGAGQKACATLSVFAAWRYSDEGTIPPRADGVEQRRFERLAASLPMTSGRLAIVVCGVIGAVSCSGANDSNEETIHTPVGRGGSGNVADATTRDPGAGGTSGASAIDAGRTAGNSAPEGDDAGGTDGSAGAGGVAGNPAVAGTGGAAGSAASGGAGMGGGDPVAPDTPAPADVSTWADPGPFGSRVVSNSGPDGAFTLFVPDPLAGDGTPNPIITWGNGSFTTPTSYRSLLSHYATHGIFVVASNDTNVGSGRQMISGMRWAIAENDREGSEYFGKLDPDAVGSIGYSQGGIGAVIAGNEPEVKTTIPIAGGDASIVNIEHPIFLIGNENDTAATIEVISPQFTANENSTFVFGILLGAGHLETLGDGGRHRGYTTAWLAYHLLGDQEAYRVFFGDEQCTLCTDSEWDTQRKNLP
jgi:hypothetical protein